LKFSATNNGSEDVTLIIELKLAKELGIVALSIFSGFHIVVRQVRKEFQTKEPPLAAYLEPEEGLLDVLERYNISHILRAEDQKADNLTKLEGSDNLEKIEMIPIKTL